MDDPIKERKTLFEKIKDLYEKHILRPPMKNNYFVSPYKIDSVIGPNYSSDEWKKLNEKWARLSDIMSATGCSCDEMRNALIQFGNTKIK